MADSPSGFTLFSLQNICVVTTWFHTLEEKLGPEFFPETPHCIAAHTEESHLVLDVGHAYPLEPLQSKGWQNETRSSWRFVNSGWGWFLFGPVLSTSAVPFRFPLLPIAPIAYICSHHIKQDNNYKNSMYSACKKIWIPTLCINFTSKFFHTNSSHYVTYNSSLTGVKADAFCSPPVLSTPKICASSNIQHLLKTRTRCFITI